MFASLRQTQIFRCAAASETPFGQFHLLTVCCCLIVLMDRFHSFTETHRTSCQETVNPAEKFEITPKLKCYLNVDRGKGTAY